MGKRNSTMCSRQRKLDDNLNENFSEKAAKARFDNSTMCSRNLKQRKVDDNFALKILKAKEGNQIFSPINIAHAFGLLLYGACGDTKKEIVKILGYGELKPLQHAFNQITSMPYAY